ncbi:MAG TPA: HAD family phosphatase [Candidatus Saccharimonadales bacterium]|nr:HAD family phosphatase [Candidatus Saccharimonadales bacterium]
MKKFAAFDFDGTLIRWQLFMAVFYELAEEKLIDEKDYKEVRKLFDAWRERTSDKAYEQYADAAIKTFDNHVRRLNVSLFDKAVEKVFAKYKDQVYTYTRDLVKDLKDKGYYLIAISGSQYQIVEKVSEYYGFDEWTGTKYTRIGDRFGGYEEFPAGKKGRALQEIIDKQGLSIEESIAVGDTESDIPMLELAENPIAFNPNKALLEHAKSKKWPVVIERKSVVYRFEYDNGSYKLI